MHPYLSSLIGGALMGISCVLYLYGCGKIAGISGLLAHALRPKSWFRSSGFYFVMGLICCSMLLNVFFSISVSIDASTGMLLLSGALVGLGSRMGSGCTSGHGICGLSRLSKRSALAVLCFMSSAWITVQLSHYLAT
jgi:uncharacterized membrane protein YedE/YeeE